MKNVKSVFTGVNQDLDVFERLYSLRFRTTTIYPLHPPHAISKDKLEEYNAGFFFAEKKDGVNAFLLASREGAWIKLRNGQVWYSATPMRPFFADLEICKDTVFVLDAVRNSDDDMKSPFIRRSMMRIEVARALRLLGISAESQRFFSYKKKESLVSESVEGIIVVPYSAPFPDAFHTSVLKYKHVETIDVDIVRSCDARAMTEGVYDCLGCEGDKVCFTPTPVALCRQDNSDARAVLSVIVPNGEWGLFEGVIHDGVFVRQRYRDDKKYPNRWSVIHQIADRQDWVVAQSACCPVNNGAHVFLMGSDTSGICTNCAHEVSFSGGVPLQNWKSSQKESWMRDVKKKNPPKALYKAFNRSKRPWLLSDAMCEAMAKKNGLAVKRWLIANPMPRVVQK